VCCAPRSVGCTNGRRRRSRTHLPFRHWTTISRRSTYELGIWLLEQLLKPNMDSSLDVTVAGFYLGSVNVEKLTASTCDGLEQVGFAQPGQAGILQVSPLVILTRGR
jgi:hypothetical protein